MFDPMRSAELGHAARLELARHQPRGLRPIDIEEWATTLSRFIGTETALDDAERIDTIRNLEELVCVATAAQAHLAEEFARSQVDRDADLGIAPQRRGRGVAHQIALARRESPHRGQRHLGLARIVRRELPNTWAAWSSGRITEWKATLVARETACLSLEDRLAVDASVAVDHDRLEAMGERELVGTVHQLAWRIDPASEVERRRRAEHERRVTLRPAPDTMCYLTALLPVRQGVGAYAALSRAADTAKVAGDDRTRGQVMADVLAGAVLGDVTAPAVELNLVMTDSSTLGRAEDAGLLDGFGPIPAELGRELLASALSHDEWVWLRRLYADPEHGHLVAMDSRRRLFPASLARLVRLRDQHCRTPWCDAPIRHIDHARAWEEDGHTSLANGQGLCESCNHAKQGTGWLSKPGPRGSITTLTPTGHHYQSRPPAWPPRRT